jgi:hypothetical protein
LFTGRNVYRRVKIIMERSKRGDWSIEDESGYEKIDRDITRSMLCDTKSAVIVEENARHGHQPWVWQRILSGTGT